MTRLLLLLAGTVMRALPSMLREWEPNLCLQRSPQGFSAHCIPILGFDPLTEPPYTRGYSDMKTTIDRLVAHYVSDILEKAGYDDIEEEPSVFFDTHNNFQHSLLLSSGSASHRSYEPSKDAMRVLAPFFLTGGKRGKDAIAFARSVVP